MSINLVRIDDRLIHGQVVTTWVSNYQIQQILVINDKVAKDKVQQSVLGIAAPPGIKVFSFGVQQFVNILKTNPIKKRTMLLFTNSVDVLAAVEGGLLLEKLNVGGMRFLSGRRRITKAVSVTEEEENAFRKLAGRKIEIEFQMIPKDTAVDLMGLL